MTFPESAGAASPDDPGPVAGDPQQDHGGQPASADRLLTEKPVLEWTKEDWADWIETSSRVPVPSAEPTPATSHAVDISEEPEPREEREEPEAGEIDEPVDGRGPLIVDVRLPEEEHAGWVVDSDRPWDEPPELATQLEGKLHEELAPPPLVWPLGDDRPTMPGTLLRRQPVAPPAAPRRSGPQPRMAVERSHRIRSVFALLGVAVSVGVILAGLITVTVFVVGVALRRAVG